MGRLEAFELSLWTHVQAAESPISTSASPASLPSAETSAEDAAASPSSSSSNEVDWRQEYEDAFSKGYEQGVSEALAKAAELAHHADRDKEEPSPPFLPEPRVPAPIFDIKVAPGVVEVDNRPLIEVDLEEPESSTVTPESYEPPITAEPEAQPECSCSDDHWRAARRFVSRERSEAHEPSCPMYLKGAHFFPLPGPGESDGSGVYVSTCAWCGETKEMRPYGDDSGHKYDNAKTRELEARRDAIVFPTEHGEEAIDAARAAKKCVDCEAGTTGNGARCQTCGARQRAALRKQEQDAAAAGALS